MPYQEPAFLPWDGRRVPLTFLAGYLGSGKTTLINELLARTDRPIAVMVNDVGEVNIDARLIRRQQGDTIELTDGCVCCSLSEGFGAAFDQLRERPEPPDHVIVELSGVAEPDRVLPWARTAGFRLDGVITVVDVEQFLARIDTAVVGHAMRRQVEAADLIVVSKLDLVGPAVVDAVRLRIMELDPTSSIILATDVEVSSLLGLGGRRPGGEAELPTATLFDRHEVRRQMLSVPVEVADVEALLDALGPEVVRAKGIFRSPDGATWLIQAVGRRRSITLLPAAEAQEPTDLVVISVPGGPT